VRIFGQIVLHELERLIAVPVSVLNIENLEFGVLYAILGALDAFVVDNGGNAAQHDEIALAAEFVDQEFGGGWRKRLPAC
jgi:hypothetical protein